MIKKLNTIHRIDVKNEILAYLFEFVNASIIN